MIFKQYGFSFIQVLPRRSFRTHGIPDFTKGCLQVLDFHIKLAK